SRLAAQFVQRIDVKILLPCGVRYHQSIFSVRANRFVIDINPNGQKAQASSYLVENYLDFFHRKLSLLFRTRRRRRAWAGRRRWLRSCRGLRAFRSLLVWCERARLLFAEEFAELVFAESGRARD